MKNLFYLLISLCIINPSYGQYFNTRFIKDGQAITYKNCYLDFDTLYVAGVIMPKGNNQFQKHLWSKFSISGDFISQKTVYIDTVLDYYANNRNSLKIDDKIVSVGSVAFGTPIRGYISIIDKTLNTDTIFEYSDSSRQSFCFIDVIFSNNHFYISGWSQNSAGIVQLMMLKITKTGQLVWKRFYNSSINSTPSSLSILENGKLLLSSLRYRMLPFDSDFTAVNFWLVINEIDTLNGNILKTKQSTSDSIGGSVSMIKTLDNGFIFGSAEVDSVQRNSVINHGLIGKVDSNYNLVWKKKISSSYGNSFFNQIKKLADGNYLGVGECMNFDTLSSVPLSNPLKGIYAGWLVKLNEWGDILWDRKYYGVASFWEFNRLFDFAELPNGDIIAVGESTNMANDSLYTQDSIIQMGWLLRIGANGCMQGSDCGYTSIKTLKNDKTIALSIFPNPTTDKLNIESYDLDESEKYSFIVSDLSGKQMTIITSLFKNSSYIVNTADYPQGTYLVSVFQNHKIIHTHKIIKQ